MTPKSNTTQGKDKENKRGKIFKFNFLIGKKVIGPDGVRVVVMVGEKLRISFPCSIVCLKQTQ